MFIITKTQLSDGFLNDLDETLILQIGQFLREIFLVSADFFFFFFLTAAYMRVSVKNGGKFASHASFLDICSLNLAEYYFADNFLN